MLTRHFLRQFFSLDAVATGGEVKEIVAALLALLAAPGYLLAILTVLGGPRLGQFWLVKHLPPLLWYWKEEWLVLTLSMGAMAVVTAVHWKSFVLDSRDYRILGPLPLPPRLGGCSSGPPPSTRPSASVTRRSPPVALIARGWLVVGVAVVLAGFGGAMVRGQLLAGMPVAATVALGIVLPFFGLVGLRLAAAYPANLEANWVFRVTEAGRTDDHAAAIRAAALRGVVLPLVAAALVPQWFLWGPGLALPLALVCLAIGLASAEWLFLGFAKIPFTCTYLPGKANLRASWPLVAAVFLVYCVALPEVVAQALRAPTAWLILLVLLVLLWLCLRVLAGRTGRGLALVFDERAIPVVTELRLDD